MKNNKNSYDPSCLLIYVTESYEQFQIVSVFKDSAIAQVVKCMVDKVALEHVCIQVRLVSTRHSTIASYPSITASEG
jgi:hypothetical protein